MTDTTQIKHSATRQDWIWLGVVLALGIFARFWVSSLGHNYDFDSYRLVATATNHGINVYAFTSRYNYGPVWLNIVHLLDLLAGHTPLAFRWLLIGLLASADAAICLILFYRFGRLAATLFILNPVSILITGYHNQFDNLAVLLGLVAILLFGDDFDRPLNRRKFSGLLMLGLSLMTKHVFFMFSLWLAMKQRGRWQKCIVLILPPLIFLAGFLPYWSGSEGGIVHNVFEYRSSTGVYKSFYEFFLFGALKTVANPMVWWLFFLALFAFICRRWNGIDSLLFYTAVLVAFSPAIGEQYFAIAVAFASVELNFFSLAYTVSATLCIVSFQKDITTLSSVLNYLELPVIFLILALSWVLLRTHLPRRLQSALNVLKRRLGIVS